MGFAPLRPRLRRYRTHHRRSHTTLAIVSRRGVLVAALAITLGFGLLSPSPSRSHTGQVSGLPSPTDSD